MAASRTIEFNISVGGGLSRRRDSLFSRRRGKPKPILCERRQYLLDMPAAGRFYHEPNLGLADCDIRESAAMLRAQHVRALRGNARGQTRERSGAVRQNNKNLRQAAVLDQTFLDDAGDQINVDV